MDVKNLKKQISEHRKWLRLGQVAVAEYLDISKSAMSALESEENSRNIELGELMKLCKLFMCRPNDLMESTIDSSEIKALFSTRKTNFEKDVDARDVAEVNFFAYELRRAWRDGSFRPVVSKSKAQSHSISFAVDELLIEMKENAVPVDVYSIARRLGIFVKFSALTSLSGALIHPTEESGAGILLNSNQPESRLRFSLSHEIAHYFLDHYATEGCSVSLMKDNSPIEKDADSFASELLMPRHLLEAEIKKLKRDLSPIEIYKLSDKFAVSFQAMLVTLKNSRFITQEQFDIFFKSRVSDLKDEVESAGVKRQEFDPGTVQEIINDYKFNLAILDRDGIRLIQEIALHRYMEKFSISERKTPVKDIYEKVVFWLVEKREEFINISFIESVKKSLEASNVTYIDKTPQKGVLWVVSSSENDAVVEMLRKKNINFKIAEEGGKATKNKRAWYLSVKS